MSKKSVLKIIVGSILLLLILSAVAIVISFKIITATFGDISGVKRVIGIERRVVIYRDTLGIPYIQANSQTDAAFAVGFVHAQERMFQMDLLRRAAMGRLSEIFGSKTLRFDKLFRALGIFRSSENEFKRLNPEARAVLQAYSNGVNEYLRQRSSSASVEFDILGYSPFKWTPEQTLAVNKLISWELNTAYWNKIIKMHLLNKFPLKFVKEIVPVSGIRPVKMPEEALEIIANFLELNRGFKAFAGIKGMLGGSSNWAVSGKLSSGGKPIVANAIHLSFSLPNIWFAVNIKKGGLNVAGFTIPGLPVVLFGTNGFIAWTYSNLPSDNVHLFLEKTDSALTQYFYNGNWRKIKIITDTIKVKDSSAIAFNIYSTKNGVLLNSLNPLITGVSNSNGANIAVSLMSDAIKNYGSLYSYILINRAKNEKEFLEALSYYDYPRRNFIFADSSGKIGYVCAANVMETTKELRPLILPGWLESGKDKTAPVKRMPIIVNPEKQFLTAADNKGECKTSYFTANEWAASAKIKRINKLLVEKQPLNAADFIEIQRDDVADYFKPIVAYLEKAFENVKIRDKNLKLALSLLKKWKFDFNKYSQTPTIFSVFLQQLLRNIFKDKMGEGLFREFSYSGSLPLAAIVKLIEKRKSFWWNSRSTERVETRDFVLRESLSEALDFLEKKFGKDISMWQWGGLHRLTLKHLLQSNNSILNIVMNRGPFELNGNGATIFGGEYSFTNPYDVVAGQTVRFVYDFANPNKIFFAMTGGESGHIFNVHYSDLTKHWLAGKSSVLKLKLSDKERNNLKRLILLPQ